MSEQAILRTIGLTKQFGGVHAVSNLTLAIRAGGITAIVGPNGSGKTTLVNVLSGMLPIDGGAVVVQEVTLRTIVPHEIPLYGITRTFQSVRLFEQMSTLDNILVVLTERNVWGAFFERHTEFHVRRAEELLGKVGLWEKRHHPASTLSYGQRKLLEIARALAMDARVYLLDEPFAGLFPEMAKVISGILKELRAEGKTVVLIEHDMGLIRELSDHVIVMDEGKLLAEGKPEEVLERKEVIEAYLGE